MAALCLLCIEQIFLRSGGQKKATLMLKSFTVSNIQLCGEIFVLKVLKKDIQLVVVFKFPYLQCGQPGQESTDDCICNEIHNRLH